MDIQENVTLKPFNTFGIEATTRYLISIKSLADLQSFTSHPTLSQLPRLVLGGGSNVLFTQKFPFHPALFHGGVYRERGVN